MPDFSDNPTEYRVVAISVNPEGDIDALSFSTNCASFAIDVQAAEAAAIKCYKSNREHFPLLRFISGYTL